MLEACLPCQPVMWNDLIFGADHTLTKFSLSQQSSFSSPAMLSGRESMTSRDDIKMEPFVMGSADLGLLMAEPYGEGDASILTTSCHFTSDDADDQEEELLLFGGVNENVKADYNWDQCFGDLEDVDHLLSNGPDLTFGPGTTSPDGMQWHDSASPPSVQLENAIAKSPAGTEVGAGGKGNLEGFASKIEYGPTETRPSIPILEKVQDGVVKKSEYATAEGQWRGPQSSAQFVARDGLQDGKAMSGNVSLLKPDADTSIGMDMTEDNARASPVSQSDSEKASMAQAQRARRHAANRKRCEERTKRQLNHRKQLHGLAYSCSQAPPPPMPQPMSFLLSGHAAHANQPSMATLHGYPASPSILSPLQPMIRPVPPYLHVGYSPVIRKIQPVAPTFVPSQVQHGLFMGYPQPCSFPPAMPQQQQHQIRPLGDGPICPPTSTSNMTPQEKIEKLRFLQQMQARFAVEQQQQQFVAQGVTPLDSSALGNGHTQLPSVLAMRQPDVAVTTSEMKMSAAESDFEPSLSVGQTSVEATSDEEGGSLEAVVLDQLQNIMTTLQVETKLCIRDALYRLARSAMRRKASGGQNSVGEAGNSSHTSENADAASDGLETSINSDPSSSSRVSRINMSRVETQTNPIDRSIAHLLFHKKQQSSPGQAVFGGNGPVMGPTHVNLPETSSPSTWQQGNVFQGNWPAVSQALPATGSVQSVVAGGDSGGAPLIRPPFPLIIPATPMSKLQVDPGVGATENFLEQQSCLVSPMMPDSGQLQNNIVGTSMLNSELASPMESQCQTVSSEQERPTQMQGVRTSIPKDSRNGRNGTRRTRLEHASGLKEMSQLLTEGFDLKTGSLREDGNAWATSGPPQSTSGVTEEIQSQLRLSKSMGNLFDHGEASKTGPLQSGVNRQGEAMSSC